MKIKNKFVVFAALSVFSGTAAAMGNVADVTIYDSAGHSTLPVYRHKGCYYVVGRAGNEYQVRVRNALRTEIPAVVSAADAISRGIRV